MMEWLFPGGGVSTGLLPSGSRFDMGEAPGLGSETRLPLHSPPCGDAPTVTPQAGGKGLSCWANSQLSPALPPPRPPSLSVPASLPSVDLCVSCV